MTKATSTSIRQHFSELTDPRRREPGYPLMDMVIMALSAVICGADDFVAIAKFVRTKKEWFGTFLEMSKGVPSHDRFNAVFGALRPAEFEKCLLSWITSLHAVTGGQVIAIDGKTLRRSYDTASSKSAIPMVSVLKLRISLGLEARHILCRWREPNGTYFRKRKNCHFTGTTSAPLTGFFYEGARLAW